MHGIGDLPRRAEGPAYYDLSDVDLLKSMFEHTSEFCLALCVFRFRCVQAQWRTCATGRRAVSPCSHRTQLFLATAPEPTREPLRQERRAGNTLCSPRLTLEQRLEKAAELSLPERGHQVAISFIWLVSTQCLHPKWRQSLSKVAAVQKVTSTYQRVSPLAFARQIVTTIWPRTFDDPGDQHVQPRHSVCNNFHLRDTTDNAAIEPAKLVGGSVKKQKTYSYLDLSLSLLCLFLFCLSLSCSFSFSSCSFSFSSCSFSLSHFPFCYRSVSLPTLLPVQPSIFLSTYLPAYCYCKDIP